MKFIYAGSFDPVTTGHEDIIKRAAAMCDTLYVAVLTNTLKKPYFDLESRLAMLGIACAGIQNAEIVSHDGLLHELAKKLDAEAILRGVRNYADFDYGMQCYPYYRNYIPGCQTILLPAAPEFLHISSTLVREHLLLGGSVTGLVSPGVEQFIISAGKDGKR